jgi:hypothetical protein
VRGGRVIVRAWATREMPPPRNDERIALPRNFVSAGRRRQSWRACSAELVCPFRAGPWDGVGPRALPSAEIGAALWAEAECRINAELRRRTGWLQVKENSKAPEHWRTPGRFAKFCGPRAARVENGADDVSPEREVPLLTSGATSTAAGGYKVLQQRLVRLRVTGFN